MENKLNMSRRTFAVGAGVAAATMGLGLYGCGGGSKEEAASGEAAQGAALTAACAYQTTSFHPVGASSALALPSICHVLEGLYDLDVRTGETYTALAADEPVKISDTEYEIALREGAKFSDGTDVTAADVVNAIQVNLDNELYHDMLSFIASVEEKDASTVVLTLNYPFEGLMKDRLSLCKVFPAAATEEELTAGPIGSGPWMYSAVDGTDGGAIDFVPNPNYNGPKPATAATMHWDVITDGTARTTALQEGSDLVGESIPDANAEQLAAAGVTVDYVSGFGLAFLMFNTMKEPFNDKRVRQAFHYAIDREKLIANAMNGHATPNDSYLPADHPNYHKASTVYTYDPEKAKALIKEAGAEGLEFTLRVNQNWVVDLAPQIKQDLDAIGLKCTIEENAQPYQDMAESDEILAYDVFLAPGDPSCFGSDPDLLMTWFYGDNSWVSGRSCWKKADEATWQKMQDLLQLGRETTGEDQQEAWNACLDLIAEEVPLYPLFHREIATGYWADQLEGFVPYGTTGLMFLDVDAK